MENIKKTVGSRFRELRKKAGFSSAESAAEALEMHPNTVYELERGDNWLSPEMLQAAAELFKCDFGDFYSDSADSLLADLFAVASGMQKDQLRRLLAQARAIVDPESVLGGDAVRKRRSGT